MFTHIVIFKLHILGKHMHTKENANESADTSARYNYRLMA